MIHRELTDELRRAAAEYPVVTLVGPRQSGKTTLARHVFPEHAYRSLEDPDVRALAATDPRGFLRECGDAAVLDEIQRVPQLLSYIQTQVDAVPSRRAQFILTGSHQPELHQEVSQSLAGRTALLTLLPLSLAELQASGHAPDPFETIVSGCFPRLHAEGLDPIRFFRGYCQTYLERDVRQLINLRDLTAFQSFLRLLAGRVGQIVNYSSLANDVGVSAVTIRQWIAVLQASHLVFVLPPYFENFSKRVIKSPKVYFTDPGVAAYLLGLTTAEQVRRDPARGGLFENLVILEVWKTMVNRGREPSLHFFRDSNGNEVDLLLREGRELVPVEVKSAETFTTEFLKGIARFRRVSGTEGPGFVVYAGTMEQDVRDVRLLAVGHAADIVAARPKARTPAKR